MLSEKSPYVVTLLVALITWVANEYYQVTASNGYMRFEIARVGDTEGNVWNLTVQNLSERVTIRGVNLALRCASPPCFEKPQDSAAYAMDMHVPPLAVTYEPIYEAAALTMMAINMPPAASFGVEFQTRPGVDELQPLLFNSGAINVVPVEGCGLGESFDCYFASNFLLMLTVFWGFACLVLAFVMLERHSKAVENGMTTSGETSSATGEVEATDTAHAAIRSPQSRQ
ncbi:hypothetical protein [Hoeflea sp.]|uniref:hypothetical protein n=1 Tax=Hoeflea sp. TaxID=1940281 RepID=UPI003B529970